MLLYICLECGAWSDVTFADAFAKVCQSAGRSLVIGLAQASNVKVEDQPIIEPIGWFCPSNPAHGTMKQVTNEDRLYLKPALVEAEQGKERPVMNKNEPHLYTETKPSGRGSALGILCCGLVLLGFPKFVGMADIAAWIFYIVGLIVLLVGIVGVCSTTFD